MMRIVTAALKLVQDIVNLAEAGHSSAEIHKRIADPNGIAKELITALASRKAKIQDFVQNG